MFENSPSVRQAFEKFRELDEDDNDPAEEWMPRGRLASSAVLRTHGMVVMNAIDEIISSLDENSEVLELILEQGRLHARFSDGLRPESFWAIEQPFLTTVREVLGPKYTAYLDRLYRKVIHFILSLLIVGFTQTLTTNAARERRKHYRDSVASTSSTPAFMHTTTNNNNDNVNDDKSSSSERVTNCWSDGDCARTTTTTTTTTNTATASNDAAVKSAVN